MCSRNVNSHVPLEYPCFCFIWFWVAYLVIYDLGESHKNWREEPWKHVFKKEQNILWKAANNRVMNASYL